MSSQPDFMYVVSMDMRELVKCIMQAAATRQPKLFTLLRVCWFIKFQVCWLWFEMHFGMVHPMSLMFFFLRFTDPALPRPPGRSLSLSLSLSHSLTHLSDPHSPSTLDNNACFRESPKSARVHSLAYFTVRTSYLPLFICSSTRASSQFTGM